ncbi:hypothetical protein MiSe_08820 [Microseira wollei NIES-4236]|uniref:Uncharacterized protein n=1 Tax=Microseira wollei NIES-4236 TaxID=2530354 RepID=A0AAV3X736_9CYAN|nr:hypothetical protein MiSe_08820 [Microseira wollei NIES-4236]
MYADSISLEDTTVSDQRNGSLESSMDNSQAEVNSLTPLLPRSAWGSQVAFLRVVFRAKKALDRIEREVGVLKS